MKYRFPPGGAWLWCLRRRHYLIFLPAFNLRAQRYDTIVVFIMMRSWIFVSFVIVLSVLIAGLQSFPEKSASGQSLKLLLIGIDGASWNLMRNPLSEGKLPHFEALIRSGASGSLKTTVPTWSPLLWTSIATGKLPNKHGITATISPENGKLIPTGGKRSTKAFWNILSDAGRRVGVVNWWVTWPAEEVKGFIVSDRYRRVGTLLNQRLTYPPDLIEQLPKVGVTPTGFEYEKKLYGLPENLNEIMRTGNNEGMNYKIYWGQDKAVLESSKLLLEEKNVEVFAVIFRIVDISSHLFWSFLDPETRNDPSNADAAYSKVLEPIYIYADRILGDLLKYRNSRTTVMICSDHGFRWIDGKYDHNGMAIPPDGILILNGPAFERNHRITGASLEDITPTLLYLLGAPLGRDMDGRVLYDAFRPEFLNEHDPQYVRTHDQKMGRTPGQEMDRETEQDFRALGYIQ